MYYIYISRHLKDTKFDILKNFIFHFLLYRQKKNRFIEKNHEQLIIVLNNCGSDSVCVVDHRLIETQFSGDPRTFFVFINPQESRKRMSLKWVFRRFSMTFYNAMGTRNNFLLS